MSDDPQVTPPQLEVLASGKTAADAADIAREAALAFRRHGFDKPSGAWWGADGTSFHRFRIAVPPPPQILAIAFVSGVAGLLALAVIGSQRKRARP